MARFIQMVIRPIDDTEDIDNLVDAPDEDYMTVCTNIDVIAMYDVHKAIILLNYGGAVQFFKVRNSEDVRDAIGRV